MNALNMSIEHSHMHDGLKTIMRILQPVPDFRFFYLFAPNATVIHATDTFGKCVAVRNRNVDFGGEKKKKRNNESSVCTNPQTNQIE